MIKSCAEARESRVGEQLSSHLGWVIKRVYNKYIRVYLYSIYTYMYVYTYRYSLTSQTPGAHCGGNGQTLTSQHHPARYRTRQTRTSYLKDVRRYFGAVQSRLTFIQLHIYTYIHTKLCFFFPSFPAYLYIYIISIQLLSISFVYIYLLTR